MTHLRKSLITSLFALAIFLPSGEVQAKKSYGYDNSPRQHQEQSSHHNNGNHWQGSNKPQNHRGNGGGVRYNHAPNYNFNLHVPPYLKNSRSRLPVLIVIDSKGNYRGHSSQYFYRAKAAREGFILAYTYNDNRYTSRHDTDRIVQSVIRMLDGHYRVDTRRINVRYD